MKFKGILLGCRVPFADFVGWLTLGNKAADEHWTPAAELCVACQANYTFIGHSEHFSDDIKVRLLKIYLNSHAVGMAVA